MALAAVGGDDEQEEQGRSQHHLLGEEVLNLGGSLQLLFGRHCTYCCWKLDNRNPWRVFVICSPGCFGQLLGIIQPSAFPPTNFPRYTLLRPLWLGFKKICRNCAVMVFLVRKMMVQARERKLSCVRQYSHLASKGREGPQYWPHQGSSFLLSKFIPAFGRKE